MALSEAEFSILPDFQMTAGYFAFSSFSAFATVLPPEVAKQTAVLPERSQLSRNVSMMRGAVYHQIGKPMKTVSYPLISCGSAAISGREAASCPSS